MEDRGENTVPTHKKSKKKKKHKPKKTLTQAVSLEQNSVQSSESFGNPGDAHSENESGAGNNVLPLKSEVESAGEVPGDISNKGSVVPAVEAKGFSESNISSRKNNLWLHNCRKENSLNRAVEENHSNSLTESSVEEVALNSQDCTDSGAASKILNHHGRDVFDLVQENLNTGKGDQDTDLAKLSCDSANCKMAISEAAAESGQKTKAQSKAERKAAFEAQQQHNKEPQKSKATTKADRRALQEAQRAKKATVQKSDSNAEVKSSQSIPDANKSGTKPSVVFTAKLEREKVVEKMKSSPTASKTEDKKTVSLKIGSGHRKARLFVHLPQYQWDEDLTADFLAIGAIHPAVIRIGLQIAQGLITGANARTVAMMLALKQAIKDYTTPPQKELSRDLEARLRPFVSFLNKCRPLSAGMENEVKKLKWEINHIPSDMSDTEAKVKLCEAIDTNVKNDITLAETAICWSICSKILNDDVILTYSCSSVVKGVLSYAHSQGRRFQVIVVDSRPRLEGREMVRYLARKGIPCTYILISAVSYVIKEVTKVILGAHSLQANGYVMSRVGSSQIALIARASNVPVLVCCETYKFSERVHTDSFVYNELGNPHDLVTTTPSHKCSLDNWRDIPSLRLLNLAYDVTPPNLVTAVITDLGMLPCTSVPVVLRVKHVAGQEQ